MEESFLQGLRCFDGPCWRHWNEELSGWSPPRCGALVEPVQALDVRTHELVHHPIRKYARSDIKIEKQTSVIFCYVMVHPRRGHINRAVGTLPSQAAARCLPLLWLLENIGFSGSQHAGKGEGGDCLELSTEPLVHSLSEVGPRKGSAVHAFRQGVHDSTDVI